MPYVEGSELRDNPYAPLSKYAKDLIAEKGEETPIAWMMPVERYVEKLATPDVTVADLIGDVELDLFVLEGFHGAVAAGVLRELFG